MDQAVRDIIVVGKELLRVLGQAVAAIAERRVIVEVADAGVEADTFNNASGIQTFCYCLQPILALTPHRRIFQSYLPLFSC